MEETVGVLFGILVIAPVVWVLFDARNIDVRKGRLSGSLDMGPWGWFVLCLLLWLPGVFLYLTKRGELKRINGV